MFQRLEGDCARGFWCGGKQLGTQVHLRDLPFSSRSSMVLLLLCKSLVLHAFVYHLLAWVLGLVAKAVQLTFCDVVAFIQSLRCVVDALDSLWDTLGEQTNAQISLYLINIFLSFPKICWIKFLFKGILINALKICGLVRSLDLFFTFLGSEWTSFIFSATFGQGTQGLSPLPYSLL